MKVYREVPAQAVPNAQVAFRAVDLACAILGLEGLRVRFFRPARDRYARGDAALADLGRFLGDWEGHAMANEQDIAGVTYGPEPGTIWVRADLDLDQTIHVVLHEAQHVADFRALGPVKSELDRLNRESAAEEFAWQWSRKLAHQRSQR